MTISWRKAHIETRIELAWKSITILWKKSPYRNTERTFIKKALTTYCSNCGQLIEHDYPPYWERCAVRIRVRPGVRLEGWTSSLYRMASLWRHSDVTRGKEWRHTDLLPKLKVKEIWFSIATLNCGKINDSEIK